jgi:hypothetical protein
MTGRDLVVTGPTYIAHNQTFNLGEELVEVGPVPADDLEPCALGRFVTPTGEWDAATVKLKEHRAVILRGQPGSGRRTAALRLLLDLCAPGRLHDLTPAWEQPRVSLLPPMLPEHGYVLDMTEPAENWPEVEFGTRLLDRARQNAIYLVVITTDEAWSGRWTGGARAAEIRFESPVARQLITCQLRAAGAEHRLLLLNAEDFAEIWKSRPKAEDARRLAQLIADPANRSAEQIAAEYGDWRDWISQSLPSALDPRVLMWSCAFCDGGTRKSVLKMAEDLRRHLGAERIDREVLLDPPASRRLEAASIQTHGDKVLLSPGQHGLAQAVCRHLWDEYEGQRAILTRWLKEQVTALPLRDARRVVNAVLDLVIRYRDDKLLTAMRDTLTGERRPLAVEAFSKAALDPRFSAHVRSRLYTWLKYSPSQELIDVVAEVCGGQFGIQEPDMALTRLRLAAQKSQSGSFELGEAFTSLAMCHPAKVFAAIDGWLSAPSSSRAGINAFLGLALFEEGARVLCEKASPDDTGARGTVISYFHRALGDPASCETALSVITRWGNAAQHGRLDRELTIRILARALAPHLRDNVMARFPDAIDITTYWGCVFEAAIINARQTANDGGLADHPLIPNG